MEIDLPRKFYLQPKSEQETNKKKQQQKTN